MSKMSERIAAAKKAMEKVAPLVWWKPETVGETILGVVGRQFSIPTQDFGEAQAFEMHDAESGEILSVLASAVIRSELEKKGIKAGHLIGIKFLGIPEGKQYKSYGVEDFGPITPEKTDS